MKFIIKFFYLSVTAHAFAVDRGHTVLDEIRDILITVKTTGKNHNTRMELLFQTWSIHINPCTKSCATYHSAQYTIKSIYRLSPCLFEIVRCDSLG